MTYTKDQEKIFKESFASRRRRQIALTFLWLAVTLVLLLIPRKAPASYILEPLLLLVLAATILVSFFNWRCPGCKAFLGKQTRRPVICPRRPEKKGLRQPVSI